MKLLCLSGDESVGKQVCSVADEMQWNAMWIHDQKSMSQAIAQFNPDLVLVDVAQEVGADWWQAGRNTDNPRPTLLVNAEMAEDFMVKALENGADGFLKKPVSTSLLVAKVKAIARRQAPSPARRYFGEFGLTIDIERYLVEVHGQNVPLTMTEFKILREMVVAESKVVLRADLQMKVFGQSETPNRSLDVHVCSLRKKFKPFGIEIDSVRGVGYRLSPCRV